MLKKVFLPLILILLCLTLLFSGTALFFTLTQYQSQEFIPAVPVQVDTLSVVTVSDSWADEAFASEDTELQAAAIRELLAGVQLQGGNAIAITGRLSNGDALFIDSTETLTTAANITANNSNFSVYDGFDTIITTAALMGMEVLLIPTDESGAALSTDDLTALPAAMTALLSTYDLRLLTDSGSTFATIRTDSTNAAELLTYQVSVLANAASGESTTDSTNGTDAADATENATTDTEATETTTAGTDATASTTATAVQTLYYIVSNPEVAALSFAQSGEEISLLLGDYDTLTSGETDTTMQLFSTYYADGAELPDISVYLAADYARTLAVTYPTKSGSSISTSTVFLMGTSNPDEPLTMNGETVERFGTEGVWGVLVSLSYGSNYLSFENGADTLDYTVSRVSSSSSSSSSSGGSYYALPAGQTIIITDDIASALSNAYSASTITQTLYEGAVVEVTQYVSYATKSDPYAYQLSTGDWVRAAYCSLYGTSRMTLGEASIRYNDETRASVITLTGGTPAVYHNWEGNTLTLTLMTTDYSGSAPTSDWFTCEVGVDGSGNTVFTFTFTDDEPLYGWAVNYDTATNTTEISLKQQPHLSDDESLPLAGVRVLLDAGHGDTDGGAMGAGGLDASCEKDVNLALTMATAYRLEQLGATVILTRDDDSFPSLGDRVTALNTVHPDYFISIHHNSLELVTDINQATGVEAYWFYDEAEVFAEDLINAVGEAASRNIREQTYGYYYVTRSNICPATLLEVGFMTNPWEFENVTDIDTIWAEAGAIAQTIYETVAANG